MDYYKKIDKSIFRYGTTIPIALVDSFTFDKPLKPGESRELTLNWESKKKKYKAYLCNVNRTNAPSVYQIRWDSNYDLILDLKKEFIQSYVVIWSKAYEASSQNKRYMTKLLGGNQEVMIFKPINISEVELETFIKIPTAYDNMFKKFIEENVFGWLSKVGKDYLITKSTDWLDITELNKHLDASFVVYYLIDEEHKEIYIGSAKRLGDRVKENRKEIPGWKKFKYEIIHPDYHSLLQRIEFHAIRAFASFLMNNGNVPYYHISEFKLVNKKWPKIG